MKRLKKQGAKTMTDFIRRDKHGDTVVFTSDRYYAGIKYLTVRCLSASSMNQITGNSVEVYLSADDEESLCDFLLDRRYPVESEIEDIGPPHQ